MNKIINTTNHISDDAKSIIINTKRVNGKSVNNLQDFYETINKHVYEGTTTATTTEYGIVKLAKTIESDDGVLTGKLLNTIKFSDLATTTKYGRVKIENVSKLKTGMVGGPNVVNVKGLVFFLNNNAPTTKLYGYPKLIDNRYILGSTDKSLVSTVENLNYVMNNTIPSIGNATTKTSGLVSIFKESDVGTTPKTNNNIILSPRIFHKLLATTKEHGLVRLGTIGEFNNGVDGVALITKRLFGLRTTLNKISSDISNIERQQSEKMASRIPYITKIATEAINKRVGDNNSSLMAVGDILYGINSSTDYNNGKVVSPSGQYLEILEYPELYGLIGDNYGKVGTKFKLPDLRGMYLRAIGISDDIKETEEYKFYIGEKGLVFEEPVLGEVQRQMVATHHHAKLWSDSYSRGTSFGRHDDNKHYGSVNTIHRGNAQYTTDGGEIISRTGIKDYPNPEGMINEDKETRPWSMAVNIYMRIK